MKKRILSAFMAMVLVVSTAIPGFSADIKVKGFDDVDETNWAYENIMKCVEKGAINGTRNPDENGIGSFSPKDKVTMGTFMAVLARLVCPEKITGTPKTNESWAAPYYRALYSAKVLTSATIGGRYFKIANLDHEIDREAMAYLLVKCAEYMGETLSIDEYAKESIVDYSEVSEFHFEDTILRAYSNGLITGYDNGKFGPNDRMTREQMATVVCRLMKYAPRPQIDFKAKVDAYNAVADYFYKSGMVKPEVQIEVVKNNFNNIRLYKNAKNELCVDVSAVSFSKELTDAGWTLVVGAAPLDISGVAVDTDSGWYLNSGESVSGHVAKLYGDTVPIKVSDFTEISVSMRLYHKDYTENAQMLYFKSISSITNVITGFYRYGTHMKNENIYMDVSGVYKDLGLK